jgi:hypothetical protein|tara:strand:- start:357 stop:758 length:402 start_codon:yes stop_codon:yes gene_type:complete
MNNYKLTKWGAERLVHYYEDICDWGSDQYNEDKYTSILQDVLYHTMKTGQLIIPEKYPEIKDILSVDMESGLWMDEMNVDYLDNHNCIYSKNIGCSRTTLLKTIDQYQFLTKEFDKDDVHPIQFKKELEKRYE